MTKPNTTTTASSISTTTTTTTARNTTRLRMITATMSSATSGMSPPLLLLISFFILAFISSTSAIGINYGTIADNLPPPAQVADFIRHRTSIDAVKLFSSDTEIIQAFAGTGIPLTITVPDDQIIPFAGRPSSAPSWVAAHVVPFVPASNIARIAVGNEVMASGDKNLIARLVPAMRNLHAALSAVGLSRIQVTTPHSLGILSTSSPPSAGSFRRGYDRAIFAPMLEFLRSTKSPFMVNPYPYFGFGPKTLNYALFRPNSGIHDAGTGITYKNMFDGQVDAVYSAMKKLGYGDVDIVIGETGWSSAGDANQPANNVENAVSYNGNLIRHVNSGVGTPLLPGRKFETYIFSLFNENQKPSVAEQNFGLFRPDFSPVYDVGVLVGQHGGPTPTPVPGPSKRWCLAKQGTDPRSLQSNIDYACSTGGVDCSAIQPGGACFSPNTVQSHANYVMNAYFQKSGRHDFNCDFGQTGIITTADPSNGGCVYSA